MGDEQQAQQHIRVGAGGLNLHAETDALDTDQLGRMTNLVRFRPGGIHVRPGMNFFTTGNYSLDHHSMIRLNIGIREVSASFMRVVGAGSHVYQGKASNPLNFLSGEWSGQPLVLLTARPFGSGNDYVFIADTAKMRQVHKTGPETAEEFEIGLPKPAVPVVSVQPQAQTVIDNFGAAGWTNNQGSGAAPPLNAVAPGIEGNSVAFTTTGGEDPDTGYYQHWGKANSKNLDSVGGSPASDEDLIDFYLMMDRPDIVAAVRVYFVLGDFDPEALPGADPEENQNFYMKEFAPSEFAPSLSARDTVLETGKAKRETDILAEGLAKGVPIDERTTESLRTVLDGVEGRRVKRAILAPGANQWTHFGVVGRPLRRGEFQRGGTDENLSWADVSGMVIYAQITTGENVNISIDEMRLVGGAGPDTTEIGYAEYDYRCTNYNTATGDEGNPSDEQSSGVNAARQGISVNPAAYGNASVRQRFYRRGGKLVDNWYFVGENSSDGGAFTDTITDDEAVTAGTLEIDNDQPVTTVDEDGNTIYSNPLHSLWMVGDIMCGCGDDNRPGFMYSSKPGKFGSWPAANGVEVCSGSERLMMGFQRGGQGFVFSREKLYSLSAGSTSGAFASNPTSCSRGLVNRHALAMTPAGAAFVSWDGIFLTEGGPEVSLTDGWVGDLFRSDYDSLNGYSPVNWADHNSLRLTYFKGELFFFYKDTAGANRGLVYSFEDKYWRAYGFLANMGTFGYVETQETGEQVLFLGGRGGVFIHIAGAPGDATVDAAGVVTTNQVQYEWETGFLNQGAPRQKKLYSDLVIDVDRQAAPGSFVVQTRYNNGVVTDTPSTTAGGTFLFGAASTSQTQATGPFGGTAAGRMRYTFDLKDAGGRRGPQYAYNIALRITGSCLTNVANRHSFYYAGFSYLIQPDTIIERVTAWDNLGRVTHKWFKGVQIEWEPDSNNFDPNRALASAEIYGDDGETPKVTINLLPADVLQLGSISSQRYVTQTSFTEFRAHHVHLRPLGTTGVSGERVAIRIHRIDWIADEEPAHLPRWETQEQNFGIHGWHTPLFGQITLRLGVTGNVEAGFTVIPVTLTIIQGDQSERRGTPGGSITNTYQIPEILESGDEATPKRTYWVPFKSVRGISTKFILASSGHFWLYREETSVWVMPWGGREPMKVQPFGNDDLDLVRAMYSASGVVRAPGGGES